MVEKYIFYLDFDSELPDFYYSLAERFSHQGISLIPVKPDQLISFLNQHEMTYVISLTSKLSHIKKFQSKIKRLFKSGLNNNTLTVYHISSFSRLNLARTNMIAKNYFWIQLPIDVESLVKYLGKHYITHIGRKLTWPGGKRSTLPVGIAK
jgi:hypothetical protein